MKFKSLFNKKVEKVENEKKREKNSFKKMLAVGATALAIMSCDIDNNIQDYSVSDDDKIEEVSDSTVNKNLIYCEVNKKDVPFSNNISLIENEYMYLKNDVKFTFNKLENKKAHFTLKGDNSLEEVILLPNTSINVSDKYGNVNTLVFCSYDSKEKEIHVASDEKINPFIVKGIENEVIEKEFKSEEGITFEQVITRTYYVIEGNTLFEKPLAKENNIILPSLENNLNGKLFFDNSYWNSLSSISKVELYTLAAFYEGMKEGNSFEFQNKRITLLGVDGEEHFKQFRFLVVSENTGLSKKMIAIENELTSFVFDNEELTFLVQKGINDNYDFKIIGDYLTFTKKGISKDYNLEGLIFPAKYSFTSSENSTKLELYVNIDFEKLIKRKERN